VELGVPGPHDVPGAARASRNSPSPCPGIADVVAVVEEAGVLLVGEAMAVGGVPDEVEVLENVEEVSGIEVLVEAGLVGVLVPEAASPPP
jgi:hypothetical protein